MTTIHKKRKLSIGIVTPEIMGPSHGGVGTAYHALAESLSHDGNDVTLLFVPLEHPKDSLFQKWHHAYQKRNIHLKLLPAETSPKIHSLWQNAARSYRVMRWLESLPDFDILHFPDGKALGYYTILSKHQGLAFKNTQMVLGAHSSTFWDAVYSFGDKSYYQDFLERTFLERECARLADYIVSPSRYYLGFLKNEQKFSLPETSYAQPNIMFSEVGRHPGQERTLFDNKDVKEFVFFGRLEKRKGLVLLCDALDHPSLRGRNDFAVSFMGHSAFINGLTAQEYLKRRSQNWRFSFQIIPRKERDDAIRYLQEPGRVALIPSLSETMSYTVLECLWAGIPFLASKVGGIPELIHPDQIDQATFMPNPSSLSDKLIKALNDGVQPSEPAFDIEENEKRWINWHQIIAPQQAEKFPSNQFQPKVTVSVSYAEMNESSIEKLHKEMRSQAYSNTEWIACFFSSASDKQTDDTGSKSLLKKLEFLGVKTLFHEYTDPAVIKNLAASLSTGDFLFFMENNTDLLPSAIETLVSVSQKTNADIVTAAYLRKQQTNTSQPEDAIHFYLGDCLSLGFLHNVFGENACFIRRSAWEKIGGISPTEYGRDHFYEFLLKAIHAGLKLETIPLPLFRANDDDTTARKGSKFLHPHPYITTQAPAEIHDLLYFLQASRFFHDPAPDGSFTHGFANRPQVFVDELWSSRPWKVFFPWANRIRKVLGMPLYIYPHVTTLTEALKAVDVIHQSFYWNFVTPIIRIRRWVKLRMQ